MASSSSRQPIDDADDAESCRRSRFEPVGDTAASSGGF